MDGQLDCSIMSTPGGVVEDLWAECSGYRTPPSSGLLLLLVVVPADGRSAGEVVAQSDTSLCELHSAEADVFASKGSVASMKDSGVRSGRGGGESSLSQQFAKDGETVGVICPAIDIGDTFLTGCWSPC